MGQFTFMLCSALTEINVDTENPNFIGLNGILFDKAGTTLVQYPTGRTDTTYEIPANVTVIGKGAFATWHSLTGITIPDGLTSIGDGAFYECSSLISLAIPESVTSIGDYVFEECTSLTGMTIPGGVTKIGVNTFAYCDSLTGIILPDGITSIGNYAFAWCEALTGLTIPENVTSIGDAAFRDCISLTSLTIPGSVTRIGNWAFEWCSSLREITFLGQVPPIIDGPSNWLDDTNTDLLGHAYAGSDFPAPGNSFNGLTMGDTLVCRITNISPVAALVLYTQGTAVTQTFAASYENYGFVTSATLAVDADEPLTLDCSRFFESVALSLGTHTITLAIKDAASNETTHTWQVTVIQDKTAPVLAGIVQNQKIVSGSPVTVSIMDNLSGVNWGSLKVYLDNKDVTAKILMTVNGFTLPSSILGKVDHAIKISVSDNVGNTVTVKREFKVK